MFLVDKLQGNKVSPRRKFQNMVHTVNFLRHTYMNSKDLPTQAKLALITPTKIRTEDEIDKIQRLMSRYSFFQGLKQKYGLAVFQAFCSNLFFRRFDSNQNIIRIGSEGYTFYVLISGSVGVYIYQPVKKLSKYKMTQMKLYKNSLLPDENVNYEEVQIALLQQGDSFGELALLDSTTKTTATVRSKEICEFACLERKQFWDILGRIKQKELDQTMMFMKNLSFIKNWYEQDLKTMSYHFKQIVLERKQVLFRAGDIPRGIYFVHQGFIELVGLIKVQNKYHDELDQLQIKNKILYTKKVIISHIPQGGLFGEEEFFGKEERQFTAICGSQNAVVYYIYKADLERRIWQKDNKEILMGMIENRAGWRTQREQDYTDNIQQKLVSLNDSIETKTQNRALVLNSIGRYQSSPQSNSLQKSKSLSLNLNRIQGRKFTSQIRVNLFQAEQQLDVSFQVEDGNYSKDSDKSKIKNNFLKNSLSAIEQASLLGLKFKKLSFQNKHRKDKESKDHFLKSIKSIGLIEYNSENASSRLKETIAKSMSLSKIFKDQKSTQSNSIRKIHSKMQIGKELHIKNNNFKLTLPQDCSNYFQTFKKKLVSKGDTSILNLISKNQISDNTTTGITTKSYHVNETPIQTTQCFNSANNPQGKISPSILFRKTQNTTPVNFKIKKFS